MKTEQISLSRKGAALEAYLWRDDKKFSNAARRQTALIMPGGGYQALSEREAEPVALAYLAQGFNAFVLRYSVGRGAVWPEPLEDAREALTLIRRRAEEWNVDAGKIAAVGFSAGGHLAAALSVQGEERPDAMILCYPCLGQPQCGLMAMNPPALLGTADDKTPPAFLFATFEDEIVPVTHTLDFAAELARLERPAECHVFQRGIHGLSLAQPHTSSGRRAKTDSDAAQWFDLSVRWLRRLWGDYPADQPDFRPIARQEGRYGVDILGSSLMENPCCLRLLCEYYPLLRRREYAWCARPMTIRAMNGLLPPGMGLAEERLQELDQRLAQIPLPDPGDSDRK